MRPIIITQTMLLLVSNSYLRNNPVSHLKGLIKQINSMRHLIHQRISELASQASTLLSIDKHQVQFNIDAVFPDLAPSIINYAHHNQDLMSFSELTREVEITDSEMIDYCNCLYNEELARQLLESGDYPDEVSIYDILDHLF